MSHLNIHGEIILPACMLLCFDLFSSCFENVNLEQPADNFVLFEQFETKIRLEKSWIFPILSFGQLTN